MTHTALFWSRIEPWEKQWVRCELCAHKCAIAPNHQGICGVRENRDGVLYSLVYGRTIARHIDPIEKKPLYHFQPGSQSYSIAAPGCNFRCAYCQNWEISQMPREQGAILGSPATPIEIARAAQSSGCASVAYTYTEPTVFAEYALDVAREAQRLGLRNVFVTNGYMGEKLLGQMAGLIDGLNVDLKAGRDDFYHRISGASLEPVLANLKRIVQLGMWLEVTTLLIPTLNDSDEEIRWIARYLHDELGPDVPWHISRYYPQYRLTDVPPTPPSTLERAWHIGRAAGLRYVYIGNMMGHASESTYCPSCGAVLIARVGYQTRISYRQDGACASCGIRIPGVDMRLSA